MPANVFSRTDTHAHTTASDSTVTPAQLMEEARDAGLTAIGLTDHDTISGWEEAAARVADSGVALLRGMEISARFEGITVHILGYLFDPSASALVQHIREVRDSRIERAKEIVRRLAVDFPISWDDVVSVSAPGSTIGRPHIADALVELGIVPHRSAAFAEILAPKSSYYLPYYVPEVTQAIEWIVEAGGKAVMAHPAAPQRGRVIPPRALDVCTEAGLFGVEIDHSENNAEMASELWQHAHRLGLARFGASDYHGAGKLNRLGENTTAPTIVEDLVAGTYLEVIRP